MEQENLDFVKKFFFDEELIRTHEGPSGVEIGVVEDKLCLKLVGFFTPIIDPSKAHPAYDGRTIAVSCIVIDKDYSNEFAALIDFLHGNDSMKEAVDGISFGKWENLFKGKDRRDSMTAIRDIVLENTHIMISENHPGDISVFAACDSEKFSDDEYNMLVSTYEKCLRELSKYVLCFPADRWVDVATQSIDSMFMGDFGKNFPGGVQDKLGDISSLFARDTMYQLLAVADTINIAVNTFDSWKKFTTTFPGHWVSKAHNNYVKVVGAYNQIDPTVVVKEHFKDIYSGTH